MPRLSGICTACSLYFHRGHYNVTLHKHLAIYHSKLLGAVSKEQVTMSKPKPKHMQWGTLTYWFGYAGSNEIIATSYARTIHEAVNSNPKKNNITLLFVYPCPRQA